MKEFPTMGIQLAKTVILSEKGPLKKSTESKDISATVLDNAK